MLTIEGLSAGLKPIARQWGEPVRLSTDGFPARSWRATRWFVMARRAGGELGAGARAACCARPSPRAHVFAASEDQAFCVLFRINGILPSLFWVHKKKK